MKSKIKFAISGAVLNIVMWNLGLSLFRWFGDRSSPVENYGIIAGWGIALYAAGLFKSPISAMPLCMFIYIVWEFVGMATGRIHFSTDLPATAHVFVILGRSIIFASPIALNWVVLLVLGWKESDEKQRPGADQP